MAGASGRGPHGRGIAGRVRRLRFPSRRAVLHRRGAPPGFRLSRPAAAHAVAVGRLRGRPRALADGGPRAARPRHGVLRGPHRAHRTRSRRVTPGELLAAVTVALSGYLSAGHLDSTSTFDLLFWALILWLFVKLLAGGDRRLWLALGVVAGIGLENKDTLLSSSSGWVRRRPCATLGHHALAVGLGGGRSRAPHLGAQPRLAGQPWLSATHHGSRDRRERRRQPGRARVRVLAHRRAVPLPGGHRRLPLVASGEGCRTVARHSHRRHRHPRRRGGQRGQSLLRGRHRARLHGGGRAAPRPLAGPRAPTPAHGGLHRCGGPLGHAHRLPDLAHPAGRHVREDVAALPSRRRPSRSAGRSSSRRCRGWSRPYPPKSVLTRSS